MKKGVKMKIEISVLDKNKNWNTLCDENGNSCLFDKENARKMILVHPDKNNTEFRLHCKVFTYVIPGWIV
jgi:hypothetical protein